MNHFKCCYPKKKEETYNTRTIRVWHIYLHSVDFTVNVGKYTIHGWYGIYIYRLLRLLQLSPEAHYLMGQMRRTIQEDSDESFVDGR